MNLQPGIHIPHFRYLQFVEPEDPERLPWQWVRINDETAEYLLECVPPIRWEGNAFAVGEAFTHTREGEPVHDVVVQVKQKWYICPKELRLFNPAAFTAEVLEEAS